MLTEFGKILLFFIFGALLVGAGLITAWLLRPSQSYPEKDSTYECGEEPIGSPWIRVNIRFYVVALIFLIFDVEVAFLFPWALVYKNFGVFGFLEMVVFLFILFVGYAYVWVKGDLNWDKPQPLVPTIKKQNQSESTEQTAMKSAEEA
ncbi:MAG TPA: NADH-quinone oxidoreductase subunit A [Bacteroidota bacterium]|nr:NADH-quinone oxidoreductase subunit A [Bacteroidota bacterium]